MKNTLKWFLTSCFAAKIKLKHGDDPDSDFDPIQLQKGIKVEMEHTDDENIAKQIAKAHLTEIKNYYDLLDRMEKGLCKKTKN